MTTFPKECLDDDSLKFLAKGICQDPILSWHLWHLEKCDSCCDKLASLTNRQNRSSSDSSVPRISSNPNLVTLENATQNKIELPPGADLSRVRHNLQSVFPKIEMPRFSSPESPDEIGQLGEFKIIRQIGAGHSALVFEALDTWLNRRVALKVLRRDLTNLQNGKALFLAEAKAIASINHENVVPILRIGHHGDDIFLVMPLLHGESLRTALEQRSFSTNEALRIIREAASGLAAAHKVGLIHCDIKPNNIWLLKQDDGSEKAVLLDFGLSALNTMNMVAGTPGFMAPEQLRGGKLDHKTDLFGLGCLLLEILRPKSDPNQASPDIENTDSKTFQRKIAPLLPLLESLLDPDPAKRPADAAQLVKSIKRIESRSFGRKFNQISAACILLLGFGLILKNQLTSDKIKSSTPLATAPTPPAPETPNKVTEKKPQRDLTFDIEPEIVLVGNDPSSITSSSSGNEVAWINKSGRVYVLPRLTRENLSSISFVSELKNARIALSRDAQFIGLATENGEVEVWATGIMDGQKPNRIYAEKFNTKATRGIAFSHELLPRVAIAADQFSVIINPHLAQGHGNTNFHFTDPLPYEPASVMWQPGTNHVIFTVKDGGILIWNPLEHKVVAGFRYHTSPPVYLTCNPQGENFASASADAMLVTYKNNELNRPVNGPPSWKYENVIFMNNPVNGLTMLGDSTILTFYKTNPSIPMQFVGINQHNNQRCILRCGTQKLAEIASSLGGNHIFARSDNNDLLIFNLSQIVQRINRDEN